jgi:hypothetical protein
MAPAKLVKYQNEIVHDSNTNKNNYAINVSFLDNNNQKHTYQFSRGQDAIQGETKIDAIESGQEQETSNVGTTGSQNTN